VASRWWVDDDQLLTVLGDALRAGAVPDQLVEAGRQAFVAHDLDAQFAALVYDSAFDDQRALAAAARADPAPAPAPLRALRFSGPALTIEIEIAEDGILGQFLPPQPGVVNVQLARGENLVVVADEAGGFLIRPTPSVSFRLRCRTHGGVSVITDWVPL
jgi:hypothetical protein